MIRNSLPTIEEAFDIKTLSPSSITKWGGEFGDEGMWYMQYILKNRFEGSPESIRGKVVEDEFEQMLCGNYKDNLSRAKEKYIIQCKEAEEKGEDLDKTKYEKELNSLEGFIEQSKRSIEEMGLKRHFSSQSRIQVTLGKDIPLELSGYIDFDFIEHYLDLKTTHRIPRKGPKSDHKMQISSYAKSRGDKCAKILYLSAKDYQAYSLVDREIEAGFNALRQKAKFITDRLNAAIVLSSINATDPKDELVKLISPKFEGFSWKDKDMMFIREKNLWQIEDLEIVKISEDKRNGSELFDEMIKDMKRKGN
jgi:hypothetical protein